VGKDENVENILGSLMKDPIFKKRSGSWRKGPFLVYWAKARPVRAQEALCSQVGKGDTSKNVRTLTVTGIGSWSITLSLQFSIG
jgi:hypothetical protein